VALSSSRSADVFAGVHLKCCLPLLESLKFCLRSSGASLLGPVPTGAVDRDNSPWTFCPLGGGFKSVLLQDPQVDDAAKVFGFDLSR